MLIVSATNVVYYIIRLMPVSVDDLAAAAWRGLGRLRDGKLPAPGGQLASRPLRRPSPAGRLVEHGSISPHSYLACSRALPGRSCAHILILYDFSRGVRQWGRLMFTRVLCTIGLAVSASAVALSPSPASAVPIEIDLSITFAPPAGTTDWLLDGTGDIFLGDASVPIVEFRPGGKSRERLKLSKTLRIPAWSEAPAA